MQVLRTVLVIDDDEMIAASIKQGLEHKRYAVAAYTDPVKAVADFEPGTYSLVICDIRMPAMDGLEVCRHLLQKEKDLKICLITAFDMSGDELNKQVSELPIQALVNKPFSLRQLAATLERVLARTSDGRVNIESQA
jgi:CheY-like chemotaxis protein